MDDVNEVAADLPVIFDLTPLNPVYRADPHGLLDDLRDRCPVHRDDFAGSFVLTRYQDVRPLVTDLTQWRDPLLAEDAAIIMKTQLNDKVGTLPRSETTSILLLDNPDHERIRRPLMTAFYKRVAAFRPHAERIVGQTLDRIDASAPFDLIEMFCVPIPIDAIATILGVSQDRLVDFRAWSEGIIQSLNPFRTEAETDNMKACEEALFDYFNELMAIRRAAPGDDLISDMVQQQDAGAQVSDAELRMNLSALLVGGNLTTTDLIGNAVRQLLLNPAELAKLRADPALIGSVVEETLRFEGPVDITQRVAPRDMEIGGCPVKKTQSVTVSLRAANHDPAVFDRPHDFAIGLKRAPHVAFGGGAHICIGAPLARLEAQVAIAMLFERFADLRLADAAAEPVWRTLPFFRGLQSLMVAAA